MNLIREASSFQKCNKNVQKYMARWRQTARGKILGGRMRHNKKRSTDSMKYNTQVLRC
jgi:hypothetical protein